MELGFNSYKTQSDLSNATPVFNKKSVDKAKLNDTVVNLLIPLVSLLSALLLAIFYIIPSAQNLQAKRDEVTELVKLSENLSQKLKKLNDLVDFKSSVDQNVALIERALPVEPLVPELLTQVDLISRESGLTVTKLSYSLGESADLAPDEGTYVVVSLGVQGTFVQFKNFLRQLEDGARVVNVKNLRYSIDSTENSNILDISLVLTAPYLSVDSSASTDEPLALDIRDEYFISLVDRIKNLRFYEIGVENLIDLNELSGTPVEDELTPETQKDDTEVTSEEIESLLKQQIGEPIAD